MYVAGHRLCSIYMLMIPLHEKLRVHRTPVMTDEDFSAMLEYCFTQQGRITSFDVENSSMTGL